MRDYYEYRQTLSIEVQLYLYRYMQTTTISVLYGTYRLFKILLMEKTREQKLIYTISISSTSKVNSSSGTSQIFQ